MKEIKYIYWFAFYNDDSPSVRYRAKYPLIYFDEHYGVKSCLIIPGYKPKRIFKFLKHYFSALFFRKKDAVIVIQRVHSNFLYANFLKLLVIVQRNYTIYDLDDSDYLYHPTKRIYWFAKNCHAIASGSIAITNHLSQFNSNIFQTSSPTPDLKIHKTKRNSVLRIGWIGGFGGDHKKGLITTVFPAILALKIECNFLMMGVTNKNDKVYIENYFKSNKNITTEIPLALNWLDEHAIQQKIVTIDVGIATLVDNEIQRSKSGIKAKQYLNNGIPVLSTQLPENNRVIQDGVNGYFCNNSAEFHEKLMMIYTMSNSEYERLATNARNSISAFNHQHYFNQFSEVLKYY